MSIEALLLNELEALVVLVHELPQQFARWRRRTHRRIKTLAGCLVELQNFTLAENSIGPLESGGNQEGRQIAASLIGSRLLKAGLDTEWDAKVNSCLLSFQPRCHNNLNALSPGRLTI